MTAVAYYARLATVRSRHAARRINIVTDRGWGRLEVSEADVSFDEPGEPNTGRWSLPIPPFLIAMLQEWIAQAGFAAPEALLFRTRNDTRPSASNWRRACHRALESVGC